MRHYVQTAMLVVLALSAASGQISWQAVNNGLGADTLVRTIVVSSGGNILIGTSEGGYRSTNHGNLWTALIPPGTIEVQTLALDPAHVYAGTDHGMFLSTDVGTSWGPINNGFPDALVLAIAINSSGHVLAGTDVNGLYRSTDVGANWLQLTIGLTSLDMVVLAYLSPSAVLAGTDGAGMFVSSDNGNNWTQSNAGLGDLLTRSITVDHAGRVFVGTNTGGLFRSTNAGQVWTAVTGLNNFSIVSLITHPNGELYAGTVGDGVFRSTDNGVTWSAANSGLTNHNVYALAVDSSMYVYAGTAGGGVFRTAQPVNVTPDTRRSLPASYGLLQNYPNPFNPTTEVGYSMGDAGFVSLKVYDMLGREVRTLVNEVEQPGTHTVPFDGSGLSGGVYLYRIQVGDFVASKKLLLLK